MNPPPLPPKQKQASRWKVPLIIIGSILGILLLFAGLVAFFFLTASEFEPTTTQKETLITIDYVAETFEVDPTQGTEEWTSEEYFDGSREIYYLYEDEYNLVDCTITIEGSKSDAITTYTSSWQGFKLGTKIGDSEVELNEQSDLFSWGDDSKFVFQGIGGDRDGFVFIARKDTKVYFLDIWGFILEDPEDISAFLLPKLELFDAESYASD